MKRLVVEIVHAPYGRENAKLGLLMAKEWARSGKKVVVALHNDGVYAAKKGQRGPTDQDMPSIEDLVNEIIAAGGRVMADLLCMEVRGIDKEMLIDGVEAADGSVMVEMTRTEGEGVLTF